MIPLKCCMLWQAQVRSDSWSLPLEKDRSAFILLRYALCMDHGDQTCAAVRLQFHLCHLMTHKLITVSRGAAEGSSCVFLIITRRNICWRNRAMIEPVLSFLLLFFKDYIIYSLTTLYCFYVCVRQKTKRTANKKVSLSSRLGDEYVGESFVWVVEVAKVFKCILL